MLLSKALQMQQDLEDKKHEVIIGNLENKIKEQSDAFEKKNFELQAAEGLLAEAEAKISELKTAGRKPYFIEGGGHGNIGTEAYVQCYREIREYEKEKNARFDYIFFASGTGTTHAGLVCGQLLSGDERKIVGISIARKNPRGRDVVLESIRSYLGDRAAEEQIQEKTVFIDDYTSGYGKQDRRVVETIETALKNYGIPLDATYTGKAFMGMREYIRKEQIKGKNILFIHTGGTPLFFDTLKKLSEGE